MTVRNGASDRYGAADGVPVRRLVRGCAGLEMHVAELADDGNDGAGERAR
jgi:hypothetical protein